MPELQPRAIHNFKKYDSFKTLYNSKQKTVPYSEVTETLSKIVKSEEKQAFNSVLYSGVDLIASKSDRWMKTFASQLSIRMFGSVNPNFTKQFRKLGDEERQTIQSELVEFKNANYAVDTSEIVETNILPILEGLIRQSPLMSLVDVRTDTKNKKLNEWDTEKSAEMLAKGANGTLTDDFIRGSLELSTTSRKVQASTSINERDLMDFDPIELADFFARLIRRNNNKLEEQILYANNGSYSANNLQRGIVNDYGLSTNGGPLATDLYIGAIQTDLAGSGAGDDIEALELVDQDLPTDLDDGEEAGYGIVVNRATYLRIKNARNAVSGDKYFKENEAPTINGKPLIKSSTVANNQTIWTRSQNYTLIIADNATLLSDQGIPDFLGGDIQYRTTVYCDGAPRMAFKHVTGRTISTGNETPNNQNRNYHRYANLLASYAA